MIFFLYFLPWCLFLVAVLIPALLAWSFVFAHFPFIMNQTTLYILQDEHNGSVWRLTFFSTFFNLSEVIYMNKLRVAGCLLTCPNQTPWWLLIAALHYSTYLKVLRNHGICSVSALIWLKMFLELNFIQPYLYEAKMCKALLSITGMRPFHSNIFSQLFPMYVSIEEF